MKNLTENKQEVFSLGKQTVLEEFFPDKKYITVLITTITFIALGVVITCFGAAAGILYEESEPGNFVNNFLLATYIILGVSIPAYIISIIFVFPYYKAISYILTTQEIVVNKGFLVKRTKIVPYRNITNFVMRRGILERLIGGSNFGTVLVETAGQGPQQNHPEQRLTGIMDVSGYADKLRGILSKMKGQAGITADIETASSLDDEVLLAQILGTLKEISKKL